MSWTTQNPGIGDTATLRTRAGTMNTIVLQLDHARTQMRTQHDALTADRWSGAAADSFRQSCQTTLTRITTLISSLAPYSAALVSYAAEIDDIHEQDELLDQQGAEAQRDLEAANKILNDFPPPGVVVTAAQIRRASTKRADARATLASVARDRADLVQRRQDADAAVESALGAVAIADWATAGIALTTAGITRPDLLDADAIRDALLDLADLAAEGHPESIDQLAALLAKWRDDPIVLRDFLDELGGEGLADLLTRLDVTRAEGTSDAPRLLQEELRRTLSLAAPLWSDAEATTFAGALVDAREGAVPIAFLFADVEGAPMPPHLVQALADSTQDWEQDHGTLFTVQYLNAGEGMAADLLYRPLGEGMYRLDPADGLFRHLAADPTATLEWFADAEHGKKRADYWYGTRDWHDGGGYTAPMLAWEAMQHVPGGLLGPDMDRATAEALATVNATIINAWADLETYYDGYMDPEARAALAAIVSVHLPVWVETVSTLNNAATSTSATEYVRVHWLGEDGDGWLVDISQRALAIMLAQIERDPTAAGILLNAVTDLQARLVASVGTVPEMTYDGALERIIGLLGMVDGAKLANELSAAAAQDQAVDQLIGIGGLLAGEALSSGGFAASLAVAGAEDLASSAWANNYDTVLNDLWSTDHDATSDEDDAAARAEDTKKALANLVEGWVPEQIIHTGGQSTEQYLRDMMSPYYDKRDALDITKVR